MFEEYEWAGQTRIRATSLLEGGFRGNNCYNRVLQLKIPSVAVRCGHMT